MKILYSFCGVAGIFFPVGLPKDGGTCEFASKKCLKECAAFKHSTDKTKIPYKNKVAVYRYITLMPLFTVCSQITKEMILLNSKVLYWFASGDCIRKYTQRIIQVIRHLSMAGVIQSGFTRNKKLWDSVKEITNIALTVEDKSKVELLKMTGRIAVPNFKTGEVQLFSHNYTSGNMCSLSYFSTDKIKVKANCNDCHKNKRGCFAEI